MANGRQESDWARFSALMAAIWNSAGKQLKSGKTCSADEFNPFAKKKQRKKPDIVLDAKQSVQLMASMMGLSFKKEG